MVRTRDIEDVLSAIRRLVENEVPEARPASDAPTLLLSQAQRVGEIEDPFQTVRVRRQKDRAESGAGDAPAAKVGEETVDPEAAEEATAAKVQPSALETADGMWTRALEAIDLPGDYAEDADFEDAETGFPVDMTAVESREAEPQARPPTTTERAGVPSPLSDLSTDLVDEDRLRAMIADVVRQELSGELGERITRNVRKLVRREIRQMLASGDLD